jgi:hypothetical protein
MGVGGQHHAPAALPTGKRPGTHCTGGWVGPRAGLDGCGKSPPPPPGFDRRTVQHVASRNTDWAFPGPHYIRWQSVNCYIRRIASFGAENWTLRKVEKKYPEIFEMWCSRRMENISSTDQERNEEVLQSITEDRNILRAVKKKEG